MSRTTDQLAGVLAERGLDLAADTSVGAYNSLVEPAHRLPGDDCCTVMVVGNTRALWPHIEEYVATNYHRLDHPVDQYVETVIGVATGEIAGLIDVRYSHEPPPRLVAIQRLAHISGLAWLSPSHLCVHPSFGPWIALRAAIVLDEPVGDPNPEPDPPCHCHLNCLPLLDQALAAGEPANGTELAERWRLWLAVRDACPVGRSHRYSDEQIVYHYTGIRPDGWPATSRPG